jgi:hypothetical protein
MDLDLSADEVTAFATAFRAPSRGPYCGPVAVLATGWTPDIEWRLNDRSSGNDGTPWHGLGDH